MSDRPETRIEDYNEIEKGFKSPDPLVRRLARNAKDRIDGESREERELRQRFVIAHRYRDKQSIEELHWKIKERAMRDGR